MPARPLAGKKNHNLVADGLVGKLTKAVMKLEAESN